MYYISVENGSIDYNKHKGLVDFEHYIIDDLTNGVLTLFHFVQTKKEVNEIVKIVKETAIDVHVYKLVKIKNDPNLQKKLNSNPWS